METDLGDHQRCPEPFDFAKTQLTGGHLCRRRIVLESSSVNGYQDYDKGKLTCCRRVEI